MCKIPKSSQYQSGSTNNTDQGQELHVDFELQIIDADVESVDLDEREIVIGETKSRFHVHLNPQIRHLHLLFVVQNQHVVLDLDPYY